MYLQVYTSTPSRAIASKIAKKIVQQKLGACVQIIGPITSVYYWQRKIEHAKEWLCIIKTKKSLYKKVEKCIAAEHPYEVPEILAHPIQQGNELYLRWIDKVVSKKS